MCKPDDVVVCTCLCLGLISIVVDNSVIKLYILIYYVLYYISITK